MIPLCTTTSFLVIKKGNKTFYITGRCLGGRVDGQFTKIIALHPHSVLDLGAHGP